MGGPSTPTNTTTTTNENPWIGAVPYLTGKNRGIFNLANQFYNQYSGLSGQQQGLNTDYYNQLAQRAGIGTGGGGFDWTKSMQGGQTQAGQMSGGQQQPGNYGYDASKALGTGQSYVIPDYLQRPAGMERRPDGNSYIPDNLQRPDGYGRYPGDATSGGAQTSGVPGGGVQGISDVDIIKGIAGGFMGGAYDPRLGFTPGRTAETTTGSITGVFQGMGELDPTQSLKSLMSGQIDNPYLQSIHQGNINTSLRGYSDALRDAATQIMPGIGDEAFASGMYGGSRQGVAEGLVGEQLVRNARDLGIAAMDTGNQLYGNAYQFAKGQQGDISNLLANQGYGMEQFNVGNINQGNQFNAGQLQNADQFNANLDIQQQQARAQNAMQGVQTLQQGNQLADTTFNQMQSILAAPMAQQQNALNQYANIISPGAAMGGSSSQQIPVYSNTTGQLIGGGATLAGLLASLQ